MWKLGFDFPFNWQLYTPGQVFLKILSVLVALVKVTGLSLHKVSEDLHVVGLQFRGNLEGKGHEHNRIPVRTAGVLRRRAMEDPGVTKY